MQVRQSLSQKDKWDHLATTWYDSGPPSVPSKEDLAIYRRLLLVEGPKKVILLGCTPSLRHLLALEIGPQPKTYIVDFSETIWRTTTDYLNPAWDETFILADWCEDWGTNIVADVIIGDRALDNVEIHRRADFFASLRAHAHPRTLFINHTAVRDRKLETMTIHDVLDRWTEQQLTGSSLTDCADGLWDDLLTIGIREVDGGAILSVRELSSTLVTLSRSHRTPVAQTRLLDTLLTRYEWALQAEWFTSDADQIREAADGRWVAPNMRHSHDYEAALHHPFILMRPALP